MWLDALARINNGYGTAGILRGSAREVRHPLAALKGTLLDQSAKLPSAAIQREREQESTPATALSPIDHFAGFVHDTARSRTV